jgi:hypothetical protein
MRRERGAWLDDDGDLQVFVPGLMATGILVSIVMLIWDGIKRFLPDLGRKQRAVTMAERTFGRVNDLASIELGDAPGRQRVGRVRRGRLASLCLAGVSWLASTGIAAVTFEAYNATSGRLAGRGWTLSIGLGLATVLATLGAIWMLSSLLSATSQPRWLRGAHERWPIGDLPDLTERDLRADA